MTTYYYYHLDLDAALAWVGVPGHVVWYFLADQPEPPAPWGDKKARPAAAVAAVVASIDRDLRDGTPLDMLTLGPTKDPLPPPPPPPYLSDLHAYLRQHDVVEFFSAAGRSHAVA